MSALPQTVYPLKQVLEVKKKRVEDAEKVLKEKMEVLEKEKQVLAQKEAERDKAKKHHEEKLEQLRNTLDHESTVPKIQQMRYYLKMVKERVQVEEKKVQEQKKQVETAEKNVQLARENLRVKRQEVDKLHTHQNSWLKEVRKEQEIIEGREQDELGSVIYLSRRKQDLNS